MPDVTRSMDGAGPNDLSETLLSGATTVVSGVPKRVLAGRKAVQATVTGAGAVSATIQIYGSVSAPTDKTDMVLLGTLTPNGTNKAQDAITFDGPYAYLLADQTAISGTGAASTCKVGY